MKEEIKNKMAELIKLCEENGISCIVAQSSSETGVDMGIAGNSYTCIGLADEIKELCRVVNRQEYQHAAA